MPFEHVAHLAAIRLDAPFLIVHGVPSRGITSPRSSGNVIVSRRVESRGGIEVLVLCAMMPIWFEYAATNGAVPCSS